MLIDKWHLSTIRRQPMNRGQPMVAFEPKPKCVLVKVLPREEKRNGIIVPMNSSSQETAQVVRVGKHPEGEDDCPYVEGHTVVIDRYSGKELELQGEKYILLRTEEILGRLEQT
jgi:co-chaperonin GroES (HSP10)